jgi:hypothetical protein
MAVSAERLSASIRFGTCLTVMFNPPVDDGTVVVDGELSIVLGGLTVDEVATGMLVDVLVFAGGRADVVFRGWVLVAT